MIILDTCALIFDALNPDKLTFKAKKMIFLAEKANQLFCSDISLWEIAMLLQKKRLEVDMDPQSFLELVLQARGIQILNITPEIASFSVGEVGFHHFDPADRIIVATAICHNASLVTCDKKITEFKKLSVIW